ncbi:alkaline phosphatase [Paenibacillus polymyxa]|uniref:Alkaline phosphatase n=1 Tax=Paenibacillus polymyxa TaxID=1406 RepID=A0A378XZN2_PAEPO|nr:MULTISPECIES: alkaline phosphatase [Paenibacillus]KAF6658706.1 alkaline phosphatase [Paenibacillus sp. EKM301P]KJD41633.1 alkaline phosphatase [Paenibacillus polymyxa]KJK30711.1 alkaline phosphatase [Paenibacillus polymyxa]MBE7896370.1 alkaline phosphatase [Paenibacillus polymyxa]MBG9765717.1 alkaline phosphatase [Paenibacillus polymyxa]
MLKCWGIHTKKSVAALLATMMLTVSGGTAMAVEKDTTIKNVIILIPDGMANDATALARWYKGSSLTLDSMASGMVRTHSADAPIADSAPAGTAFATGHKSHTGYVGVLPDEATMPGQQPIAAGDAKKPVASILEASKLAGKSTGIIATSEIMHATPADFTAHYPDRKNYDALSMQQAYNGVDVVLGGGGKFLEPAGRKDGQDLIAQIKDQGYDFVTTPEGLKNSTSSKLWGSFSPEALAYDLDRDASKEPSLAEMTTKAIDVLSKNDKGFFLMVEGSKVDWAAHANDPTGIISDVLSFDDAVKVALDYAKQNQNTVVVAVTDHGNGGLTIGSSDTTSNYDKTPLASFIDPLKKAKLTGEGLESKLNADRSNIKEVLSTYFGITDLSDEEVKTIKDAKEGSMNYAVGPIISKRANIGWTTGGHTGGDVVLYTYAPNGDRPSGVIDNTDVNKYMTRVLGLDLDTVSKQLFVPAKAAFEAKGAKFTADTKVITVTKGSNKLELPVYKNIATLNGKNSTLNGVVVFNGVDYFVPQQAIDLIQ